MKADDLTIAVRALVDELARAGVQHVCVCPGSRSTPLALVAARHPQLRIWMHLDERSASFFALGLAKAAQQPVALLCTSGTAAANFLPAVVEAWHSRIPLVVLTADRPHELRDRGAPQTIDQIRLFGSHAKWFVDLPEPLATLEDYLRTTAARAVATATAAPAGPVHLNCPFREPLLPATEAHLPSVPAARPTMQVAAGRASLDEQRIAALAAEYAGAEHGLIIAGPNDQRDLPRALLPLAEALGYPILADPLANVRAERHPLIISSYDAFVRDQRFAERMVPEVVLRFGAMPTSKPLLLYLQRFPECRTTTVDPGGGWNDFAGLATRFVHVDPVGLCQQLVASAGGTRTSVWAEQWQQADQCAKHVIRSHFAHQDALFEGKVFAELAHLLPDQSTLFVGNSMPVRDLDTFFWDCGAVRVLANRGANGIDGVVSSALGASAVSDQPLVLVIGDVSFYHDTNGLLAAQRYGLNATIIVLNNNGGGIFSFLPQASQPEHFEELFGTPHGLTFRPVADLYSATYSQPTNWPSFRSAVAKGTSSGGLHIVELAVPARDHNVALHRELWPQVADALAPMFAASEAR